MIRAFASFAGCAVAVVAAGAAAAADLTIVSKASRDGKPETTTSYVTATKMKMAQPGRDVIVDGAKAEYTIIDHGRKEYSVVTKDEIVQAAAQMQQKMQEAQAAMAKMQEQMKNMPPAMREKLQGLSGGMAGMTAAMIDVKKGGPARKIAGYSCDNWIVSVGELSKTEQCLTTELEISTEAWAAYRDLADAFKSVGMGQGMEQLQEKTKDLKGFPLSSATTTNVMGKSSSETSEVTEVKKGAVPANAFEIPAGYKKGDSPFKALGRKK